MTKLQSTAAFFAENYLLPAFYHIMIRNCIACHKTVKEGGFMAYIIENAHLLKEDRLEQTSLFIKNKRFDSLRPSYKRFSHMRLDANSYIMTPPHILFNPNIPFDSSFQSMKEYYIKEFITKGCTMFLTYAEVDKEYLLNSAIKRMKTKLLNSPIDYVIGVRIPLRLLTTSFLRKCKREKIPAIFIEIEEDAELESIPWGWLREAMFPYNSPLIPIFTSDKPKNRNRARAKWVSILEQEKIPFIQDELSAGEPIQHKNLCKIGIYPVKTGIHQGGEVSYNFYSKEDFYSNMGEKGLFQHYQEKLLVTVHKGTVVRAGDEIMFRPGFGEHVTIKTPSFYIK